MEVTTDRKPNFNDWTNAAYLTGALGRHEQIAKDGIGTQGMAHVAANRAILAYATLAIRALIAIGRHTARIADALEAANANRT